MPDSELWDWTYQEIATRLGGVDATSLTGGQLRALLDARVAASTDEAAKAAKATARWTKWLAAATALLALGTTALATGSYLSQRDMARESKRQSCLADVSASTALAQFSAPAFPTSTPQYAAFRGKVVQALGKEQRACR